MYRQTGKCGSINGNYITAAFFLVLGRLRGCYNHIAEQEGGVLCLYLPDCQYQEEERGEPYSFHELVLRKIRVSRSVTGKK